MSAILNGNTWTGNGVVTHKPIIPPIARVLKCPQCGERKGMDAFPADGMFGPLRKGWCWACATAGIGTRAEIAVPDKIATKRCTRCDAVKTVAEFPTRPDGKGWQSWCSCCQSEARARVAEERKQAGKPKKNAAHANTVRVRAHRIAERARRSYVCSSCGERKPFVEFASGDKGGRPHKACRGCRETPMQPTQRAIEPAPIRATVDVKFTVPSRAGLLSRIRSWFMGDRP